MEKICFLLGHPDGAEGDFGFFFMGSHRPGRWWIGGRGRTKISML